MMLLLIDLKCDPIDYRHLVEPLIYMRIHTEFTHKYSINLEQFNMDRKLRWQLFNISLATPQKCYGRVSVKIILYPSYK